MKSLILGLISLTSIQLCFAQTEKELYEAWLDSMKNDKYIGIVAQLDDVIITDSAFRMHLHDPKMHLNMQCTDQLMHCLPGVNMVRRGSFANEPMLRGLTSERYVLSIDGMRIYGACTDKMDPASAYIEPINLQSLDVSFGCQSNMTGCGTGGGVNFGLKKPIFMQEDPLRVSLRSSFSSVSNGFDQAMDVNYSRDRWAIRISGVHRKAENYTDGNRKEVRYSQFEKFNYASSVNYRLSNVSMLAFDFVGDDAHNIGYPALPMDVSTARAKMFGLTYMTDRLWFVHEPEIKVYHNFINHEMDDTQRDSVAMHMDMPGSTKTTGGFIRGFLKGTETMVVEMKVDYHRALWHAEMTMYPNEPNQLPMFMLTWPDAQRGVAGFELSSNYQVNARSRFVQSARVEQVSSFIRSDFGERQLSIFNKSGQNRRRSTLLNVSSQYQWDYARNATADFTVSYGERVPSVSEQFGFYLFNVQDGYDYLGDPDLKKERNVHLELGQKVKSSHFLLETSLFAYFFDDYILGVYDPALSNMTIGARGVKWHRNIGRATMWGGELQMDYQIFRNLNSKLDVNYVHGADFEGKPLPQMPPLKLSYSLTQRLGGWNIQPELVWSLRQGRISEKFNEQSTDGFMLFNFRVNRAFEQDNFRWSLAAGIDNITDRAYREHFDIGQILRPGRNGYVQLQIAF